MGLRKTELAAQGRAVGKAAWRKHFTRSGSEGCSWWFY